MWKRPVRTAVSKTGAVNKGSDGNKIIRSDP